MASLPDILSRKFMLPAVAVAASFFLLLAVIAGPVKAEEVLASFYGNDFAGETTANGETFDPDGFTAAHPSLEFDTKLLVTYQGNSVVVRVNDRGPFVGDRGLDLSRGAAEAIGLTSAGVDVVNVEVVDPSTPEGPVTGELPPPDTGDGAEDPVAEEPPAEDPATEDPATEDPATEDPATEDPVAEDPAVEVPGLGTDDSVVEDQYGADPGVDQTPAVPEVPEVPDVPEPDADESIVEEQYGSAPTDELPAEEVPAVDEAVAGDGLEGQLEEIEETIAEEQYADQAPVEEPAGLEDLGSEEVVSDEAAPDESGSVVPDDDLDDLGELGGVADEFEEAPVDQVVEQQYADEDDAADSGTVNTQQCVAVFGSQSAELDQAGDDNTANLDQTQVLQCLQVIQNITAAGDTDVEVPAPVQAAAGITEHHADDRPAGENKLAGVEVRTGHYHGPEDGTPEDTSSGDDHAGGYYGPAEEPVDKPADKPVDEYSGKPVEEPVDEYLGQPVEEPVGDSVAPESPERAPVIGTVELPADESGAAMLPDTGGFMLPVIGGSLVAGGLLLRRIATLG